MKKRMISTVMAAAVALTSLAGCGVTAMAEGGVVSVTIPS